MQQLIIFNEIKSVKQIITTAIALKLVSQNEIQWDLSQQISFIDSLYRKIPTSELFFGYDDIASKYSLIDGKQRVYSLIVFMNQKRAIPDLPNISLAVKTRSSHAKNIISHTLLSYKFIRYNESNNEQNDAFSLISKRLKLTHEWLIPLTFNLVFFILFLNLNNWLYLINNTLLSHVSLF